MKSRYPLIRQLLVAVLIGQLTYPSISLTNSVPKPQSQPSLPKLSPITEAALVDPLIDILAQVPKVELQGLKSDDPSLDQDPFFLRSQSWKSSEAANEEDDLQWAEEENSFSLLLPGKKEAWFVRAPLSPFALTSEYILLSGKPGNYFGADADRNDGIFVVLLSELRNAHSEKQKVPVYFMALPGNWSGRLYGQEFPEQDLLVIANQSGETLPLKTDDIGVAVSAGKLNLLMAMSLATKNSVITKANIKSLAEIFPPRGSTAGFGLLFTGLDLDRPDLSISFGSNDKSASFWSKARTLIAKVLGPSVAYAGELEDLAEAKQKASENLRENLTRVGIVVAVAYSSAIVLKYTYYREHFAKRNMADPPQGVLGKPLREWRDTNDVFAHLITTVNYFPAVWFGNGAEYIVDRYFTSLGAGQNTLLRRFLKNTVYFSRDLVESLPVNNRTLITGALVLGGIDSYLVYYQLYHFDPWFMQKMAEIFPSIKDQVEATWGLNPMTEIYARNNSILNGTEYFAGGAATVVADQKSFFMTQIEREVEKEMSGQGLDPNATKNKQLRDEKIKARLQNAMKQMGFPGEDELLFDNKVLWQGLMRLLGNTAPDGFKGTALGESRPGTIVPTVKLALKETKRFLEEDSSGPDVLGAVDRLEATLSDLSFLSQYERMAREAENSPQGRGQRDPPLSEVAKKYRSARQNLVVLTGEGPMRPELSTLQGGWFKDVDKPGTLLAAEMFRRSFFAIITGDYSALRGAAKLTPELITQHEAHAIEELRKRYPDEASGNEELRQRHKTEFRLLVQDKITLEAHEKSEQESTYQPPKKSWYQKIQEKRAKEIADQKFFTVFGRSFAFEGAEQAETDFWRTSFADAFANQLAVYPEFENNGDLRETTEAAAHLSFAAVTRQPKFEKFFNEKLSAKERYEFAATLWAESFVRAYVEEAQKSGSLSPISPAQPGRFQRFRQKPSVRNSQLKTRLWRGLETFFPIGAHKEGGLMPTIHRNVPGLYDIWLGNIRVYRTAITGATAVYWFNYILWGAALPATTWMLRLAIGAFFIRAPWQWMARAFALQGWQPAKSIRHMIGYAFVGSWVTMWGQFPTAIFAPKFKEVVEKIPRAVIGFCSTIYRQLAP